MALSRRLRAYLALERAMLDLDEEDSPLADRLRDAMDPLWYGLGDEEHAWLDARVPDADGRPARRPPRAAKRAANVVRAFRARDSELVRMELASMRGFAEVAELAPRPPSTRDDDRREPR